jgi:HlyD family secretion protein
MIITQKKWLIRAVGALVIIVLAVYAWLMYIGHRKDEGLVSGNGRIEATEIDVAAKLAERVREMYVNEGDFVRVGQVVAIMNTDVLEARRREAEANLQQAKSDLATAQSQLAQRESDKIAASAVVGQREAELEVARKSLARSSTLAAEGAASHQQEDDDIARVKSAAAALAAARAQVAAAESAVLAAGKQVAARESAIKATQATIERILADINDSVLKAPRDGRVQYRIAQPGEVVGAGGRVLNMIDFTDVYMTFFLPTKTVGQIAEGSDVRLVLDAFPQFVIPARITFIADVAQFTPKTVETAVEREKLMFRIKANIPVDVLRAHLKQVKTGLPGMAYVRLDPRKPWPAHLQVRLPQ